MSRVIPDIAVIHDSGVRPEDVTAPLAKCFLLRSQSLEAFVAGSPLKAELYLFFTNPRVQQTHALLKTALERCDGATLFVLPTHNSDSIARLDSLGIGDYVVLPIEPRKLRALAQHTINREVERAWSALEPAKRKALMTSLRCFEKCFVQLRRGQPLPMKDIQTSCQHIREAAALGGLDQWIDALDRHHNYSFRHSMFVCGSLSYFAHAIGIRGRDLELLTIGGLLHDIGKSRVPVEILDKAGKLDEPEWEVMKKHPEFSREILGREQALDRVIVDMAVAHHERIDGAGYPDGLAGARIDDYVRMTAIADVYSALTDRRVYKGAMSSRAALDLMAAQHGHLDMDLLRAFRSFVLDQDEAAAAPRAKTRVA